MLQVETRARGWDERIWNLEKLAWYERSVQKVISEVLSLFGNDFFSPVSMSKWCCGASFSAAWKGNPVHWNCRVRDQAHAVTRRPTNALYAPFRGS